MFVGVSLWMRFWDGRRRQPSPSWQGLPAPISFIRGVRELQSSNEIVYFLLGLVFLIAVALLHFADQGILLSADECPVIVG